MTASMSKGLKYSHSSSLCSSYVPFQDIVSKLLSAVKMTVKLHVYYLVHDVKRFQVYEIAIQLMCAKNNVFIIYKPCNMPHKDA